jgi:hypothetical protein
MFDFHLKKSLILLSILTVFMSACGSAAQEQANISTAVAQTVQAQNSLTKIAGTSVATSTTTPEPNFDTTRTPQALSTAGTTNTPLSGSVELCTASAAFVGETIPDGTILEPGATFTKVWSIQNDGTCAWDSTWQLIFQSGEIMGGSAAYNLPQPAQSGQTVDVPIILKAPQLGGTYTGQWMLKSPWGMTFGVGLSSVPLSVSIVVGSATPQNNRTETVFGVTAVDYDIAVRCTDANTFYTITAHITSHGPVDVVFTWAQSDGNNEPRNRLTFNEATTKSVNREWVQGNETVPNPRWVQVVINSPAYQEFGQEVLPELCP